MVEPKAHFLQVKAQLEKSPFAKKNYTCHKGISFGYLCYRILRPILKFRYNTYLKRNPDSPWITPDAVKALNQLLKPSMIGFEYGSGRSTQFYAKRLQLLTSIEHHKDWYHSVTDTLKTMGINNAKLEYIASDQDAPSQHLSSQAQLFMTVDTYPVKDDVFSAYTDRISQESDESLDFVAIDGRARATCLLNAITKLKSNGILLLDNAERKRYQLAQEQLAAWPKIYTTNGLTDTSIWLKP